MKELDRLLLQAMKLFDSMTPEEQIQHLKAQAKSWVYGNCKLSNPNVTREMVDRIVGESEEE